MNALLNHIWGENPVKDAVWSRVAAMDPDRVVRKPIMVLNLKAHMDESYSDYEFIIAGYVGSAETWAKFSGEWKEYLPWATADKYGNHRFHMTEMTSPERMKCVPLFYTQE